MARFEDQVTQWTKQTEQRLTSAYRASIQDLVEEAQEPRGSGGNLPVDTGFLRSTGDAAIDKLPVGESQNPGGSFSWSPETALLVINRAQLGDTVFFGWTAEYATYMENRYGFVRLAIQNWSQIVNNASRRIEREVRR